MNFISKTLTTTGYHLFYTLFHPKFWTAVLLVLTVTYIRIQPYAEIANDYNANVSIGILSFIYSDVLFVTVIFVSLLLIFSELPFKNAQQIFLLTRLVRKPDIIHNSGICYNNGGGSAVYNAYFGGAFIV